MLKDSELRKKLEGDEASLGERVVINWLLDLRAAVRREREADDSRSYDIETYVAARALVDRLVAGEKE